MNWYKWDITLMDLSTKWKLFLHLVITLIGVGLTRNLWWFSNLSFRVRLSKIKSETSQGYFMDRNRLQANAEGSWHWTQVQTSYRCHFKRQLELYQWSPQKQSRPIITRLFIEEKKNTHKRYPMEGHGLPVRLSITMPSLLWVQSLLCSTVIIVVLMKHLVILDCYNRTQQ